MAVIIFNHTLGNWGFFNIWWDLLLLYTLNINCDFDPVSIFQIISCTCIGGLNPAYGSSFGYSPFGSSIAPAIAPPITPAASLAASNGGPFPVTSTSPIAPTGMSVLSENLAIDGGVAVSGQLPLLGSVAMDGVFPTSGVGVVSYGCGDGAVGILSEGSVAPKVAIAPKAPISTSLGYRGYRPCGLY